MSCSHWNSDLKNPSWYEPDSPRPFKDLPPARHSKLKCIYILPWDNCTSFILGFCVKTSKKKLGLKTKMPCFAAAWLSETQHWPSHKYSQLNAVSASWDEIIAQDDTNMIYKGIYVTRENVQDSWIKLTNGIFLHAWTLPYFTWASTWADEHLMRHRNTQSWVFRMFLSLLPIGQFECELQVVFKNLILDPQRVQGRCFISFNKVNFWLI